MIVTQIKYCKHSNRK